MFSENGKDQQTGSYLAMMVFLFYFLFTTRVLLIVVTVPWHIAIKTIQKRKVIYLAVN